EASAALLELLPGLLLEPHQLLALVGLEDLLHVELHERELLLEAGARFLSRLDLGLDRLAVRGGGLPALLVVELLLLEVGPQIDQVGLGPREDLLELGVLVGAERQLLRDPGTLPPLPVEGLGARARGREEPENGEDRDPEREPLHRGSSVPRPAVASSPW